MEPEVEKHEKVEDNPNLQYLLALDFQATCQNNIKLQPCSQIIQFPVIVVQLKSLKNIAQFHQYVKPTFNPKLTKFCTELTGITQDQVDAGQTLDKVLIDLDKWMKQLIYKNILKVGKQKNYAFVTCGDWDLNTCLRHEVSQKKIDCAQYLMQYINIKNYFYKCQGQQGKKVGGMMQMLELLQIKHQGRHHSGIDDVINICEICKQLSKKFKANFPKTQVVTVAPKKAKKKYVQKH